MDKVSPLYKKDVPADDMPRNPEPPTLKLCQLVDGRLVIPNDIRKHFMNCPLFGPEWRDIVTQFDKDWGVTQAAATPSTSAPSSSTAATPPKDEVVKEEVKLEPVNWDTVFPDGFKTVDKLKEKFGTELTEMVGVSSMTSFYLAPGPQLYLGAKEAAHIKALDAPVISHGAGSWLTGDKAAKFETNNPDRGIPCRLTSDEFLAVYEDTRFT